MNRPLRKQLTLQQLLMLRVTVLLMGILILLGAALIPERLRSYDAALDEQIATDTNLSKVTVRRYLNYLIGTNEAESQVDYSTGGRPRVEYRSR